MEGFLAQGRQPFFVGSQYYFQPVATSQEGRGEERKKSISAKRGEGGRDIEVPVGSGSGRAGGCYDQTKRRERKAKKPERNQKRTLQAEGSPSRTTNKGGGIQGSSL